MAPPPEAPQAAGACAPGRPPPGGAADAEPELAVVSGAASLRPRDAGARAEREAEQRCRVRHRLAQLLDLRRPPPSKASQVTGYGYKG